MTRRIRLLLLLMDGYEHRERLRRLSRRWRRQRQFRQRRFPHHLVLLLLLRRQLLMLMLLLLHELLLLLRLKLRLHDRHSPVSDLDDAPGLHRVAPLQRRRGRQPERATVAALVVVDHVDVVVVHVVVVSVAGQVSRQRVHELQRGHEIVLSGGLEEVLWPHRDRGRAGDDDGAVLDRPRPDSLGRGSAENLRRRVRGGRHRQLRLLQLLDVGQRVGRKLERLK